jgi:GNAT superfamily N-acetyltransferase
MVDSIHTIEYNGAIIYYYGDKQFTIEEFTGGMVKSYVSGYYESTHDYNLRITRCNDLYIRYLYTDANYRNQGLATRLLRYAVLQAHKIGIVRVRLEDMSDRYKQDNNIYVKLGFVYDTDSNDGLMVCSINRMYQMNM